ncbi:MAG: hypothetical protein U1F66_01865 [bacterium]
MTTEAEKKELRELLGPDCSAAELEAIIAELPELAEAAGPLRERLGALQAAPLPELPRDFSARVMARLETEAQPTRPPRRWFTIPRLVLGSALAAGLALALWRGLPRAPELGPPLAVREALGPEGRKIYFVRFAIREAQAKEVALAGDFNQWNPTPLTPSAGGQGEFSVELPLAGGTYSYSFVVDGRRWVPDPAADRWVDDGFGQRNSVINL